MKNIVFMDVDGTLTTTVDGKEYVPESTVAAIRKTRENGNLVFLCTGRCLAESRSVDYIGFDGTVAAAGNYIEMKGKTIAHHSFRSDEVDRFMRYFEENGMTYYMECNEGMFGHRDYRPLLVKEVFHGEETAPVFNIIFPVETCDKEKVNKITFISKDVPYEKTEDTFCKDYVVVRASWNIPGYQIGEISRPGITKATAIQTVVDYIGEDVRTYAFGDSMNDLQMFQAVDVSVAMGNSMHGVERYASFVTRDILDDGIAYAMKHFGLI